MPKASVTAPPSAQPSDPPITEVLRASLGLLIVAVAAGSIYRRTMLPGTADGDAAEMQLMAPLLGICHEPGYPVQVVVGWLFSKLPLGGSIAWRLNVMMVVAGVLGVAALYGAIRRVTGQILPAIVGALTLAFSDVWWTHALFPEVYVFYGAWLAAAVYGAVRFVENGRVAWLIWLSLTLGVCVTNRPSELLIVPAFLGLWLGFRSNVRVGWPRLGLALGVAILPFIFSLGYFFARQDATALHQRDDVLRAELMGGETPFAEQSFVQKFETALGYLTARRWVAESAGRASGKLAENASKLGKLLSGERLFEKAPGWHRDPLVWYVGDRSGTSIAPLGLLLAAAATVIWRRQWGWLLLGWGLVLGNLAFFLFHSQPDNINFICPALIGFSFLAGLGAALRTDGRVGWIGRGLQLLLLAGPLALVVGNYDFVNRNSEWEARRQTLLAAVAQAPLPDNAVIASAYPTAMVARQLFYIEAGRTGVPIIIWRNFYAEQEWMRMRHALLARGLKLYWFQRSQADLPMVMENHRTPFELARLGIYEAPPIEDTPPEAFEPAATTVP